MAPQGCWKDAGGAAQARRLEALNLRAAGTLSAICRALSPAMAEETKGSPQTGTPHLEELLLLVLPDRMPPLPFARLVPVPAPLFQLLAERGKRRASAPAADGALLRS